MGTMGKKVDCCLKLLIPPRCRFLFPHRAADARTLSGGIFLPCSRKNLGQRVCPVDFHALWGWLRAISPFFWSAEGQKVVRACDPINSDRRADPGLTKKRPREPKSQRSHGDAQGSSHRGQRSCVVASLCPQRIFEGCLNS